MIPRQYKFLENIGTLPRIVSEGLSLLGVQEVVGKGSNKTILSWRDLLNQNGVKIVGYSDDDIPWCGLFMAFLSFIRRNVASEVVTSPLWARSWAKYGNYVGQRVKGVLKFAEGQKASLGDILVFFRNGGGHVAVYIAEDDNHYHVLGGNQNNSVSITRIAKSRCVAVRRPPYTVQPDSVKPYFVDAKGLVSQNEA